MDTCAVKHSPYTRNESIPRGATGEHLFHSRFGGEDVFILLFLAPFAVTLQRRVSGRTAHVRYPKVPQALCSILDLYLVN